MSTQAPSLGRGCRAQRGGVGFLFCGEAAFSLPSPRGEGFVRRYAFSHMRVFALTLWGKRYSRIAAFPIGEGGPRQRRSGTFVNCLLETISPALFHPASPSNLCPFGAPPSIGRRERPREPLPLEGAAERSEAGLASFFFAAKPPPQPRTLNSLVKQNPLTRAFSSCIITSVVVMNYVY